MINREDDTPGAIEWFRYARQVQKTQLQQLAQQGQLVSQLSHVVHMLQCERGASNIWLCSQGRLYAAERRASAALVDEQIRQLLAHLQPQYLPSASGLCQRIARAVWSLEQVPSLRESVASQQVSAETASSQFNRTIRHLLNIIKDQARNQRRVIDNKFFRQATIKRQPGYRQRIQRRDNAEVQPGLIDDNIKIIDCGCPASRCHFLNP